MRKLKYQVWDKADKKLYSVISMSDNQGLNQWVITARVTPHSDTITKEDLKMLMPGDYELLEYVGQYDTKGAEIYTGYRVKFGIRNMHSNDLMAKEGVVEFRDGVYGVAFEERQFLGFDMLRFNGVVDFEITGHKYEG